MADTEHIQQETDARKIYLLSSIETALHGVQERLDSHGEKLDRLIALLDPTTERDTTT